ncbi:MAG: aminopeptidase N [Pseudomonadales bacterium]|nr:aminopeptidase N [Pseudomonadales bacterium]
MSEDLTSKQTNPKEIRLTDYRSPEYTTETVDLTFDIKDGNTEVRSKLHVKRCLDGVSELLLNGQDLELLSVVVDGRALSGNEYTVDSETLLIPELGAEHDIEIVTVIKPEENTALEGLYKSSQMYCTQCEAEGFRKITYYQDRPDVLARFTTTIIADTERYPTLLSNGNRMRSETRVDGRSAVTWQDPFPKPSYLFALVAGDLEMIEDTFTTMTGRSVTLQIFSEAHNIGQCDYAMDVLKRSMRWDEERFGREYDLDIFMIVAVEDFNMGAMENKGLNIFNTSCVLATPDTATDAAYQRVEAVVAHEYFHNWSGNRVTCRDWFQLSLKEGFTVFRDAEFSSDMNSRAVKRIEDVGFLRTIQFAEDGGPLAHPVRPSSYLEISNFYTTTIYEKGAEVVRMYDTLLGTQKFRAGTDLYFDRFDGSAVTTDDFADVMSEVGDKDLTQFKRWYDQAGTPLVKLVERYEDGELSLDIVQSCASSPKQDAKAPYHMPLLIGVLAPDGAPLSFYDLAVDSSEEVRSSADGDSLLIELRNEQASLNLSSFEAKPVVSFLRDFSAPIRVDYARPDDELAFLVEHDVNGFVRWDALQSLWVAYFSGASELDLAQLIGKLGEQATSNEDAEQLQLIAMMLNVPEMSYLFEALGEFEVDTLLRQRDAVIGTIALENVDIWAALYEQYFADGAFQPDAKGMAQRGLKNAAFAYHVRNLRGSELVSTVQRHYQGADNLTDRRAALKAALTEPDFPVEARTDLLTDFYDKWRNEALVVDLWFNLQAQSPVLTLDEIKALEEHPAFDMKNPNRARALFSVFGMLNHSRFHAIDGSGYKYLADAIARLDALNPQIAARLSAPLTLWRRYDPVRQERMRDALSTLTTADSMSKDLYEVVTKALDN